MPEPASGPESDSRGMSASEVWWEQEQTEQLLVDDWRLRSKSGSQVQMLESPTKPIADRPGGRMRKEKERSSARKKVQYGAGTVGTEV
ncbi:hypothetical protein IAQ61_008220 [Plenodomus lingam]|uniref:uncharacterized protein n=1 Tax=Leptosphaeria maculans TaxID=5022 RepID=UPI003317CFBF|nr:hypothetical protein IAQ61_008220 [Plenodomus lingam]